ncbi:tRNA1(Val) (adenine(37)-N6)-methyltransferase [Shewanella sp. OMA3-2]|uniref:tRNA1(Val) (adenine(37)-N6)-methyltransferase n=1 Tax=Shewanella sp. OMA3-2 TaxID=2908650 RepID=UPI001F2E5939|nr:methyltransferase [Shewanella sp. OMA3-2]UJF22892.1 methyltransferase [Shewanella sp. OMA3-2]
MPFTFKQFHIDDSHCGMSVSTDGVLLGAWANLVNAERVIDIGAGSGLLSLMAAQRTSTKTHITAIELDTLAAQDCLNNIAQSPWAEKIALVSSSIQDFCLAQQKIATSCRQYFDHIICNPPYFTNGPQTQHVARATARHTNQLSFSDLAQSICTLLAKDGVASCIIPVQSEVMFKQALSGSDLDITQRIEVCSVTKKPPTRLLLAIKHLASNQQYVTDTIDIRDKQGHYSAAMTVLCKDFYLKL